MNFSAKQKISFVSCGTKYPKRCRRKTDLFAFVISRKRRANHHKNTGWHFSINWKPHAKIQGLLRKENTQNHHSAWLALIPSIILNNYRALSLYLIIKIHYFKTITGGCDTERGTLGSRMSALSRQSLDSAQMNQLSRKKDDCKSKICKEYYIYIGLYFCVKFRAVWYCCQY